jgi:RimJ/RimL family protein N-acetyltransferase
MSNCDSCGLERSPERHDEKETRCLPCKKLSTGTPSVDLSPLSEQDLELVLAWRSHPEIYAHFRQQNDPLDWDEHRSWFESRDPDRYDFVISFDGRRVGVVNIDVTDEVGIFLGDFSAQGHGVATATLQWVCKRFSSRTPLFAEIHETNDASKQLFERCGFQQQHNDGKWLQYSYDP